MKSLAFSLIVVLAICVSAHAQCVAGGSVLAEAPTVVHLRSYRPMVSAPARLAVDSAGAVYIADPAGGRVVVRAADGRVVRSLDTPEYPVSVAVDALGNVYVGEGRRGRIDVYNAAGQRALSLGGGDGEVAFPSDIGIHARTGEIFVADSGAHVIKRYGAGGGLLQTIGAKGTAPGQFDVPVSLFVDSQHDQLYVADQRNSRIQIFGTDGAFHSCIASLNPAKCGGFSLLPCGNGRQADQGLWVDAAGRIYVADAFLGTVLVLDGNGNVLTTIGTFGEGAGGLEAPADVVIDSRQRLFVSSTNGSKLEIFGVGPYFDGELYAPGRLTFRGPSFDARAATSITLYLEVPGYRLEGISPPAVVANGTASAISAIVGDVDGNGIDDLALTFGADLLQTFPATGTATITVRGSVGALRFEETAGVKLASFGDPIAQRCPCAGPVSGGEWKNHGQYVTCVVDIANTLFQRGLITFAELGALKQDAAASSCGRK